MHDASVAIAPLCFSLNEGARRCHQDCRNQSHDESSLLLLELLWLWLCCCSRPLDKSSMSPSEGWQEAQVPRW